MDVFLPGSVVWASARGDIFWPGRVAEPVNDAAKTAKKYVTINFLAENSYEDIRNPNKIFAWNCDKQNKFIEKGRGTKNLEKKVQFNKAVAEADDLFMLQANKEDNMTSQENGEEITKSPDVKRKVQSNKKKSNSGARPTPLRTSPRKKVANEKLTSSTENQCSRLAADVQPAVTNNDVEMKLESTETKKERENLKRCHASNGLQTKNNKTDSSKCDIKRRKMVQGQGKNTASALEEKKDGTSECLQAQCNGHQTAKRPLPAINREPPKRRVSPKKTKSCRQNDKENPLGNNKSFELSSKRTLKANNEKEAKKVELKMISEDGTSLSKEGADKESEEAVGINSSASSDVSSDDELLSDAFSPSQESNQFSVGDIVFAKYYREPYWPAQIKKIKGKRKYDQKFVVKFLAWNNGLFCIQPNKLIHFACDPEQWTIMMEIKGTLNEYYARLFDQALIEAEDLLNRKGLGISFNEDLDEDALEIFEETEENTTDQGEQQTVDKDLPEQTSPLFECRKSLRTKKQVSKYNNIISYIRQAKPTLKQILNGTKESERHHIYFHGRVSEKDQLKHRAGCGPIGDENLREEIMDLLLKFYKEVKGDIDFRYVSDVWLPEAIIFSIQEIDRVERERAEMMYLAGSEIAVTNTEVQALTTKLKQRKLSSEETVERVRQAERALARYMANS